MIALFCASAIVQETKPIEYTGVAKEAGFARSITCLGACRITPTDVVYWDMAGNPDPSMASRIAGWLRKEHRGLNYYLGQEPVFAVARCVPHYDWDKQDSNWISTIWPSDAQLIDKKSGLVVLRAKADPATGFLRTPVIRYKVLEGPRELPLESNAAISLGGQSITFLNATHNQSSPPYISFQYPLNQAYSYWFYRSGAPPNGQQLEIAPVTKGGQEPVSVDRFGRPSMKAADEDLPTNRHRGFVPPWFFPHPDWEQRRQIPPPDPHSLAYDSTVDPLFLRSVKFAIAEWKQGFITGIPMGPRTKSGPSKGK